MNIKKKKDTNLRKALLVVAVIVVLILVGLFYFLYLKPTNSNDNSGLTAPTEEQIKEQQKTDAENKGNFIENKDGQQVNEVTVDPTTSDNPIDLSTAQSGASVNVFTKLYNFPDGRCSLVVQNNGASRTYSADILYGEEYSTCTGFSIPVSDLGPGSWKFTLTATTSDNKEATESASLEVR